jgi:hypothetical protein
MGWHLRRTIHAATRGKLDKIGKIPNEFAARDQQDEPLAPLLAGTRQAGYLVRPITNAETHYSHDRNPPLATGTPVHIETDKLELSWALSEPEQQRQQAACCQSHPTVGQQRSGHSAQAIGLAVKHLHIGDGKTGRGTD